MKRQTICDPHPHLRFSFAAWLRGQPETVATNILFAFLTLTLLLLLACQEKEITPVELHPEDVCAGCKMAISEKKYAAEFVTVEGDALKFDDITCLTDYVAEKNNQAQIAAFFVVDLKTQQWLRGERAWLVHSPRYKTPMSGGIVAFRDKADAANEAGKTGGKLMNFEDVVKTSGKSGK